MKKSLLFFAFLLLLSLSKIFGQGSINPDPFNGLYCPLQPITFTVVVPQGPSAILTGVSGFSATIPGSNGNVLITKPANVLSQPTNISYPGGNTTKFDFTGSFQDNATPQTFRVSLTIGSSIYPYDFTFYKIQSFNPGNYGVSQPNVSPTAITAPRCQVSNFAITFPNVLFASNNPNGVATYGTIPQYQYLLPSGWSLTSNSVTTVSNGSNWITGINAATATSDLGTGDGGFIYVRAVNPCNSGLAMGPQAQIAISRPAPVLAVQNSDPVNFCSGSRTYTLTGLPAGATVLWTSSDPTVASVPANSSGSSVVLTKGANSGSITITATVTHCSYTYTAFRVVQAGTPSPTITMDLEHCPFVGVTGSLVGPPGSYVWYVNGTIYPNNSQSVHIQSLLGSFTICAAFKNICGTSTQSCVSGFCSSHPTNNIIISPNPGSGVFTVSTKPIVSLETATLKTETPDKIYKIKVLDQAGVTKKSFTYSIGTTSANMDLSGLRNGTYIVQTFNNSVWSSTQIVISK